MNYSGFFNKSERWADNRQEYERWLDRSNIHSTNMDKKHAREMLKLYERFPPQQPHDRLVAHRVDVYRVKNPTWRQKSQLDVPFGELETILTIDLGKELQKDLVEAVPEVVQKNVLLPLGDGSYVKGDVIRIPPRVFEEIAKVKKYFVVEMDSRGLGYELDLAPAQFSILEPLEYHILNYVKINGEDIRESNDILRAGFKEGKFKSWVKSKT